MLAVERQCRAVRRLGIDDVVPPVVAPVDHRRIRRGVAEASNDENVVHRRGRQQRLVDRRLQEGGLPAPPAAIRGDDELRLRVVDPARQGFGREAAEDDGVRRADAGTREHRDRELRDHRHVDRDAVALADAQRVEGAGRLLDLAVQVRIGDRPGVARLADPVVGDLAAEAVLDVPVDAVVADVQLAAVEPAREREIPVQGRIERLEPADPLAGELRPEGLEVRLGLEVQVGLGVGLGGEGGIRRERPLLMQQVLDLGVRELIGMGGFRGLVHGHDSLQAFGWRSYQFLEWRTRARGGVRLQPQNFPLQMNETGQKPTAGLP